MRADWFDAQAALSTHSVVARLLLGVWGLLLQTQSWVCAFRPPATCWLIIACRAQSLPCVVIDLEVPLLQIDSVFPQFELGWKHDSPMTGTDGVCGCHPVNVVVHDCLYGGRGSGDELFRRLLDGQQLVLYDFLILSRARGCCHASDQLIPDVLAELQVLFRRLCDHALTRCFGWTGWRLRMSTADQSCVILTHLRPNSEELLRAFDRLLG